MEFFSIFLITAYSVQESLPPEVLNFENGIKLFIQKGKHAFFLSSSPNLTIEEFETFKFSPGNILVGCGYATMYFFFLMGYNFYIAFCLTAVATLWLAVKDFCEKSLQSLDVHLGLSAAHDPEANRREERIARFVIVKENTDGVHEVDKTFLSGWLDSYIKMKKLASKINESLGEVFLVFPLFICFYYATELTIIFTPNRRLHKIKIYWFLIKEGAIMILAADICRKVSALLCVHTCF